jgi:acyl-CoA synthetase (AMP-forming)/AMP-acid ligase II
VGSLGQLDAEGRPVYPPSLWDLMVARAELTPDRVLVTDDRGRCLTAAGWRQAAEQVAAGLAELGVGQGTVVSWQLPTIMESVVLMLALARLGAVQNPIIPILRRREVGFIVAQARSALLVTPEVWRGFDFAAMAADIAAEHPLQLLTLGDEGLPTGDPARLGPHPQDDTSTVRHIYYTSGSTADPKGARHTDRSLMHGTTGAILGWGLRADDCVSIPTPITHIGGMCSTIGSLWTGSRRYLVEVFDAVRTPLAAAFRQSTLPGVALPFFQAYMAAQRALGDERLFPGVRGFICGGAPKPPELHYEMKALFGVGTISGWGMTEFPIATSCCADDTDEELATSEGRPVPGVELRVVAGGVEVGPGVEGELRLKGPQMLVGYVDAALDADAFDDQGWFRTGDLGTVGPRGHVRITGRLKDVIIRNAENISAQEVENLLYTHPKVADVAVIGVPDPVTGERACAVIVAVDGAEPPTLVELASFCREAGLASQKIPERLELVADLPRNAMGKVLKRELRATFG